MRLQWWRDVLEEIAKGSVRRHEVATPLAEVLSPDQATRLDKLVAARIWDCHRDPFEDETHLRTYLRDTSGVLMAVSSDLLGGPDGPGLDAGFGLGVATWLRAIPALEAQKRVSLVDGSVESVRKLVQEGITALKAAQTQHIPRSARPAFWPATGALAVLKAVEQTPQVVADGTIPEIGRMRLNWAVLTGRW